MQTGFCFCFCFLFFNAWGPETEEQIKLAKDKIRLYSSFEKVIRTLALRVHEKEKRQLEAITAEIKLNEQVSILL